MLSAHALWHVLNDSDEVIHWTHAVPGSQPSLPIPVMINGKLHCLSYYMLMVNRPTVDYIDFHAPTDLADLDWETGAFLSFTPKPPAFFGVRGNPFARVDKGALNREFEKWRMPITKPPEITNQALDCYDTLVPDFIAGKTPDPQIAHLFKRLMHWGIFEPEFRIYYHLGHSFFRWVGMA